MAMIIWCIRDISTSSAEDEEPATESAAAAPMEEEQADAEPSEECGPLPKRSCVRYSREQKLVLEREFEKGTARLSNRDIAMEIDMMPEGVVYIRYSMVPISL